MPEILGAKEASGFNCYFHAGETHDASLTNMHDAVLLGSKRMGHGF